jgi:hypothetical protein
MQFLDAAAVVFVCKSEHLDFFLLFIYSHLHTLFGSFLHLCPPHHPVHTETLKLVQESTGNTLELIGIGKDFLNRTPAAATKRKDE